MRRRDCMLATLLAVVLLTLLQIASSWLSYAATPADYRASQRQSASGAELRDAAELQPPTPMPPGDGTTSSTVVAVATATALTTTTRCASCSMPPATAGVGDAPAAAPAVPAATAAATAAGHDSGLPPHPVACRLLVAFEYEAARLGNKLFQYASTVGVAVRHGLPVLVVSDTPTKRRYYEIMRSVFQLSAPSTDDGALLRSVRWLGESGFALYDARAADGREFASDRCSGDVAFSGYVQSWKYFSGDAEQAAVRREYRLTPQLAERADAFLRAAAAEKLRPSSRRGATVASAAAAATWFVGVHVRRGDMTVAAGRYAVAPESYLLAAMRHFEQKLGGGGSAVAIVYAVATDDPFWVERALAGAPELYSRTAFSHGTPEMDLAVLSRCNHSIVTSGSYGWWAGWLTGGEVVYYRDYIPASSDVANQFSAADYYPPSWVGMSG